MKKYRSVIQLNSGVMSLEMYEKSPIKYRKLQKSLEGISFMERY